MSRKEKINVRYKSGRGKSKTIIGAICSEWENLVYLLGENTCTDNTIALFEKMKEHAVPNRRRVVVLDNHNAHKNNVVRAYAEEHGIILVYLPPTESEFNPIERFWGIFKHHWRKLLLNPGTDIDVSKIGDLMTMVLESIKDKGRQFAVAPFDHLLK